MVIGVGLILFIGGMVIASVFWKKKEKKVKYIERKRVLDETIKDVEETEKKFVEERKKDEKEIKNTDTTELVNRLNNILKRKRGGDESS